MRGGKTVGCLKILYALCKIFPGSRWAVIRESGPILKRNTIPSFWATCPKPFFHPDRFNRQDMVATASNGSEIIFISESFDDDPELMRFNGLEINGGIMEQAEELQKATFAKMIERSGSWNIFPEMPPPLIMLNCNPHQGWLKDQFYLPHQAGTLRAPFMFIQALIEDNKQNLNSEYLQSIEILKSQDPSLYRRMVQGSWDAEDAINQLIPWNALYLCDVDYVPPENESDILSLGIDVGRHGPDPSIWTILKNRNVIGKFKLPKSDGPEVTDTTKRIITEYNIPHHRVFMDTVGLGGFAFDFLRKDGYAIREFIAGSSAIDEGENSIFNFADLKSQAAWKMKLGIQEGKAGGITEEILRQDLGAYTYDIVGDKKIKLTPKDDMKKKLKRSPDDGDSFLYGYWGQICDTIEPMPDFLII